jgi:CHAD domain-containing protein
MLEEERKYDVDPEFTMPPLNGKLPKGGRVLALPAKTLRATYYDTADLRLARTGVSLRFRSGEAGKPPWTVKLPTSGADTRDEIVRPGPARTVPPELVALLTAYHRGERLAPAVTIRTLRRTHELRDTDGAVLVEVADDTVSVLDGSATVHQFREVEVERGTAGDRLLDHLDGVLREAGARRGVFTPKHIRALGDRVPVERPPKQRRRPRAADAVTAALRAHVADLIGADPYLRLRTDLPDGDTPVHQMRVSCRRLRSDLRTFGSLVDARWAGELRAEAGWLAEVLGAARDAEVLRGRLARTARVDPIAPLDAEAVGRLDAALAVRQAEALVALDAAVGSARYLALLDALIAAAAKPRFTDAAKEPAADVLATLVARPWRQLVGGGRDGVGAADLDQAGPDDEWHATRIRGKRARYAVEAVLRSPAGLSVLTGLAELGDALKQVQKLLGEHQDAALAAETWVRLASATPDDFPLAVTAGRLAERERAAVRRARQAFPAAWAATDNEHNTGWLNP